MSKHLQRDIKLIGKSILEIGALVEHSISNASTAIMQKQPELAQVVRENDEEINLREVELEEDCLKALALHQPVAVDLRFLIAVIKVNNTLERMGDHAYGIAKDSINLADADWPNEYHTLSEMFDKVREMVRHCLNALVEQDVLMARNVLAADDAVDLLKRNIFGMTVNLLDQGGVKPIAVLRIMLVSRHLERIADLATNIAEDVIFMVEGEIIRHQDPA